jgi:hypothetical protein
MAQAWHTRRKQLGLAQGAEAACWRATDYRLNTLGKSKVTNRDALAIEAAPNARWQRFTPFESYRPTSNARDVQAGPHLTFLKLKGLMKDSVLEGKSDLYHKALILFAKEYGLLGVFEEDYLPLRAASKERFLVAPEAVIDGQGRLRRVDPATEGKDLLLDLLENRKREFHLNESYRTMTEKSYKIANLAHRNRGSRKATSYDYLIGLPSEAKFRRKSPDRDTFWQPVDPPTELVPWEVIQKDFGAIMILDEESYLGVSVLCTREPLLRWKFALHFFLSGDYFLSGDAPVEYLASDDNHSVNLYLQEVSPRVLLGEDGNLKRGWHYRSLLQAMYIMIWLDLTGDDTIKKCQSRGCPNYFRVGSQSKSRYCSERCANRASTRMRRGQEP